MLEKVFPMFPKSTQTEHTGYVAKVFKYF